MMPVAAPLSPADTTPISLSVKDFRPGESFATQMRIVDADYVLIDVCN